MTLYYLWPIHAKKQITFYISKDLPVYLRQMHPTKLVLALRNKALMTNAYIDSVIKPSVYVSVTNIHFNTFLPFTI